MLANADLDLAADALARLHAGLPVAEPSLAERRWQSTKLSRLNANQWEDARGATINADLRANLELLRAQCELESERNPILKGVIETHAGDVVGPHGPSMNIQSDSPAFNDWAETRFGEFWECPEITGKYCGPDLLKLWLRSLWKSGELLARKVNVAQRGLGVRFRFKAMHARRLLTPALGTYLDNVVMGVELDANDRPTAYHLDLRRTSDLDYVPSVKTTRIAADKVLHEFLVIEEEQVRGIPWAGSSLQVLADIRDADDQIQDAIRGAADHGTLLSATNHDAQDQFTDFGGASVPFERRRLTALPPGYSATQMKPEQPGANVIDFRNERLREVGLPAGMPLMTIKLDAKGLNFSQAKFGNGKYWRSNEGIQGWLARRVMNPTVKEVLQEAWLEDFAAGRTAPEAPTRMQLVWKWPGPPKMDPRIEAMGQSLLRAIGQVSMTDMLRDSNKTVEQHAAELARERAAYEAQGVPYPEPDGVLETLKVLSEQIAREAEAEAGDGATEETEAEVTVEAA